MPTIDEARLSASAHQVLREAIDPALPGLYRGKVRDNYDLPDGRRMRADSADRGFALPQGHPPQITWPERVQPQARCQRASPCREPRPVRR